MHTYIYNLRNWFYGIRITTNIGGRMPYGVSMVGTSEAIDQANVNEGIGGDISIRPPDDTILDVFVDDTRPARTSREGLYLRCGTKRKSEHANLIYPLFVMVLLSFGFIFLMVVARSTRRSLRNRTHRWRRI